MSQNEPFLQQVRNTANVTLDVLLADLSINIGTAYSQANTAYGQANLAYGQANLAYTAANGAVTIAEAAYSQANTATTDAGSALTVAEEAYGQANAAYGQANIANAVTGVTAAQYGSTSAVGVFTVDARGRLTTAANVTYQTFGSAQAGIVPASGGGNANVLFANGSWAAASVLGVSGQSLTGNGYIQLASGLIIQWGVTQGSTGGGSSPNANYTNFPIAFPHACLSVVFTGQLTGNWYVGAPSYSLSEFVWGNGSETSKNNWIAIGW